MDRPSDKKDDDSFNIEEASTKRDEVSPDGNGMSGERNVRGSDVVETKLADLSLNDNVQCPTSDDQTVHATVASLSESLLQACRTNNVDLLKSILTCDQATQCPQEVAVNGLYIAAHNGYLEISRLLLEFGIDPNAPLESHRLNMDNPLADADRSISLPITSYTRRGQQIPPAGSSDSPLSCAVKYNHTDLAKLLIDYGADALHNGAFERSPLQDAIRLRRNECLRYMCADSGNDASGADLSCDNIGNVGAVLRRFKKDVVRQCLVNDNIEALTDIFILHCWSADNLNSDLLVTVLNNLMVKSKVQLDHTCDILHLIMEAIPMPRLKLYDLAIVVRFFLRLLSAQFLSISDERITLLLYRANLFFIIIKYLDSLDFSPFLPDMDFAFTTIFDGVKDTGESKSQVLDFMINFYDNLVVMGYLKLCPTVINALTEFRHVRELQPIQTYLYIRATSPMRLKELCRLAVKREMSVYKNTAICALMEGHLEERLIQYMLFLL